MKRQQQIGFRVCSTLALCLAMSGGAQAQNPPANTPPANPSATSATAVVDTYEAVKVHTGNKGGIGISYRLPLYGFSYLNIMEVQEELKLTREQIANLTKARQKAYSEFDPMQEAGGSERLAADPAARVLFYRLEGTVQRGIVADMLTEVQLKRHHEICIQWEGIRALRRQEVADALRLMPEQRAQITTYELAWDKFLKSSFSHLPQPVTPAQGRAYKAANDNAFQTMRLKCRALLTPAQLKQWQEMNGPTFKWLAHSRGQDYS